MIDCTEMRNYKEVRHNKLGFLRVYQKIGLESYAGARLEGLVERSLVYFKLLLAVVHYSKIYIFIL